MREVSNRVKCFEENARNAHGMRRGTVSAIEVLNGIRHVGTVVRGVQVNT
jgi:hypothetical protein